MAAGPGVIANALYSVSTWVPVVTTTFRTPVNASGSILPVTVSEFALVGLTTIFVAPVPRLTVVVPLKAVYWPRIPSEKLAPCCAEEGVDESRIGVPGCTTKALLSTAVSPGGRCADAACAGSRQCVQRQGHRRGGIAGDIDIRHGDSAAEAECRGTGPVGPKPVTVTFTEVPCNAVLGATDVITAWPGVTLNPWLTISVPVVAVSGRRPCARRWAGRDVDARGRGAEDLRGVQGDPRPERKHGPAAKRGVLPHDIEFGGLTLDDRSGVHHHDRRSAHGDAEAGVEHFRAGSNGHRARAHAGVRGDRNIRDRAAQAGNLKAVQSNSRAEYDVRRAGEPVSVLPGEIHVQRLPGQRHARRYPGNDRAWAAAKSC